MTSKAKPLPRLELHFQYQDVGPVLTKTYFVQDEDAVPNKTEHTDETRVQWRSGAMAFMWFFINSKLDGGPELTWLLCEPHTLMGSVHDSIKATGKIQWHNRVFGAYQLPSLINLVTPHGRPMRRLNTTRLPQDHIVVYVDGECVADNDKLATLADKIKEQWGGDGGQSGGGGQEGPPVPDIDPDKPRSGVRAKAIRITQVADGVLTIVEIDLVGYTNIAFILEENVGPDAVAKLNKDIQGFVDVGLAAAACTREESIWQTAGDGAILVFEKPRDAHVFAEAVTQATKEHNESVRKPESKRLFRIGAATGKVSTADAQLAGTKIIEAVRLESCARAGELLIDLNTYAMLPKVLQSKYGPEHSVRVKEETFRVRRWLMTRESIEEVVEPGLSSDTFDDSIFEIPYQQNPYFTGRDEQLAELRKRLTDGDQAGTIQGICGLGGIGKTQLAVHYAFRYRTNYRTVFWVKSDTETQLTDGFFSIAALLNLPRDENKRPDVIPVVKHWLQTNSDWLVIFDNADAPRLLEDYLPNVRGGHIVVTSRVNNLVALGIAQPLAIPKLQLEQATDFLLQRTGRQLDSPERPFAESLASEIDGLPLALEQAGAYIFAKGASFERYLASYQTTQSKVKMLDKQNPVAGAYDSTVATTWMVNFKEVEEESSASADLLRLSSFLDPDCIPFELIIQGAADLGPELHKFISRSEDPILAVLEALEPLARFSLVNVDDANEMYSMHRLVQEVLRARDET